MTNVANTPENVNVTVNETIAEKAQAVLKARLPHLTEARLNFEKRTGNFFTASTIVDGDGVEKMTRKVVADDDIAQCCHEEMKQKRAAALLLSYADKRAALTAEADKIQETLAQVYDHIDALDTEVTEAIAVVDACTLPERAERVTLAKQVEAQTAEIERLKALLAAAGVEA